MLFEPLEPRLPLAAGLDGFELGGLLRQTYTKKQLPIVMMSANHEFEKKSKEEGFLFFGKPFDFKKLCGVIDTLTGSAADLAIPQRFPSFREEENTGARELAFYPGCASGPAYGLGHFSYESKAGARPASIRWKGGVSPVYFNGGCLFEEPELYPSVTVLARYDDLAETPAAVVKCAVGKGEALLCGVHPEYVKNSFWRFVINH